MIPASQIVRDRSRTRFTIGIVIGPSNRAGKVRVCRWQDAGKRWSPPVAIAESQLEPIASDALTTVHHKLVVADARRAVVGGVVRWDVGGPGGLTEIADVGTTAPPPTTTEIVLGVLRASPDAWLTMRQVADRAADRQGPIKLGAIASALVNLEIGRRVEVARERRPLLYRYAPEAT